MSNSMTASNPFGSSLGNEQLVAFVADENTKAVVTQSISERWPTALVHDGGLAAALGALSQETSPSIVVVDVGDTADAASAVRSLLAVCERSTRVVALGQVNDVSLYREIIRSGAADYLVKPLTPEGLAEALLTAGSSPAPAEANGGDPNRPRIIGAVGARHGTGASTIAVNMAWIMSHEWDKTVAAIDFDLQFGTVALSLDLEPSHGLREALENPDRIDGLFIASAMGHESEKLYVLSAEEPLNDEMYIKPGAFELVVDSLPGEFDYVVVDIPPRVAVAQKALLSHLDAVALISDLSLAGMRDTVRMHQLIQDHAPNAEISLIVNKVGASKKGELPKNEFERGTELKISHAVPCDANLAASASSSGKAFPKINSRSPVVVAIRDICGTLSGTVTKEQSKGLFGKMFAKG